MANSTWYPYAPDQEFGVRVAADQETLERVVAELDARLRPAPRAGNKAPLAGQLDARQRTLWAPLLVSDADPLAGPVTTATVLEAAATESQSRG
jgi:hypothetical protein